MLQGDASSGTITAGATFHDKLALAGTGPAPQASLSAIIPVVGSTAGSFGSNFKTSVQVFNPSSSAAAGKLIFHKANNQGSSNDPSLSFNLAPGEMLAMTDVVAAMVQSGLGSMDVAMSSGQVPIVNQEYSPSAEAIELAKRIIAENAKAESAGRASFAIDGKMIDVPVVERARRLLARAAAIAAREAARR